MSSVGGVGGGGGAGAAGGAGGVGSAGASQAVAPAAGAADSGDFSASDVCTADSAKSPGEDPAEASHGSAIFSQNNNMSTQSFIELHNTAITQVNECQNSELDLKKLIEMMMAIKLLEAMNEK